VYGYELLLISLSFPNTPYIEELSSHVFDKSYYPQANSAHTINRRSFDISYQPIFCAKPNDLFNNRTGRENGRANTHKHPGLEGIA